MKMQWKWSSLPKYGSDPKLVGKPAYVVHWASGALCVIIGWWWPFSIAKSCTNAVVAV